MTDDSIPRLTAADLRRLAHREPPVGACPHCQHLVCPGWESLHSTFDRASLRRVGTLKPPGDDEPTLAEHHPAGTHSWSADAPIAPAFFPYNRCEVWLCVGCARPFLRYTEYGGYYQDERIREIQADLIDDALP
jgi:hypothetical protein